MVFFGRYDQEQNIQMECNSRLCPITGNIEATGLTADDDCGRVTFILPAFRFCDFLKIISRKDWFFESPEPPDLLRRSRISSAFRWLIKYEQLAFGGIHVMAWRLRESHQ